MREVKRIKARVENERLPQGADPTRHLKLGRGLAQRRRVVRAAAAAAARRRDPPAAHDLDARARSTRPWRPGSSPRPMRRSCATPGCSRPAPGRRSPSGPRRRPTCCPPTGRQLEGVARVLEYPPGCATPLRGGLPARHAPGPSGVRAALLRAEEHRMSAGLARQASLVHGVLEPHAQSACTIRRGQRSGRGPFALVRSTSGRMTGKHPRDPRSSCSPSRRLRDARARSYGDRTCAWYRNDRRGASRLRLIPCDGVEHEASTASSRMAAAEAGAQPRLRAVQQSADHRRAAPATHATSASFLGAGAALTRAEVLSRRHARTTAALPKGAARCACAVCVRRRSTARTRTGAGAARAA